MKKYLVLFILVTLLLTGCKTKTYTVTFIDDGEELASIDIKKGSSLKNIDIPKKDGYIFVSWLKDGLDYDINTPITEDITLSAKWTEKPELTKNHKVTFNIDGELKTQTIDDGDVAIKPTGEPVKEKHEFIGWFVGETEYDFATPVTKDIVITAKFKKNRIEVNYDLNGGTGSTIAVEIDKDSIPDKPKTPTKFGYTFTNWTINDKVYNFDTPLDTDTTIKANWVATVYIEVKFDSNGGDEIKSEMIPQGSTLTKLPTPIKEGYIFKYWTINGEEFSINTKINTDTTLVAQYEEIKENEKEDS